MIVARMNAAATDVIPSEMLKGFDVAPGDRIGFEVVYGAVGVRNMHGGGGLKRACRGGRFR